MGECATICCMKCLAFNRLGMLAGVAAVFALVLAGCFGGGGGNDDESSETTVTTTAAPVVSVVSVVTPVVPPVAPPTPTAAPAPAPTTAAPVVPTPTTAAPTSSSLTYTVQSGDTLAAIADRFNVSVDDIVDANSIDNPDVISVGQQLAIPTGGGTASGAATDSGSGSSTAGATGSTSGNTYTVASGDTLAAIANRFDVDLDALISANNIENQDVISVGQVLTIPSS